jgi:hypothetical protein
VKITNTWNNALTFRLRTKAWNTIDISSDLNVGAGQTGSFEIPPSKPDDHNFWIEVVGWNSPGVGTKSADIPRPAAGTTLNYKFIPGWPPKIVPC